MKSGHSTSNCQAHDNQQAASLQIDAALNAQAGELRRAKETLAARDDEVNKLNRQVNELTLSLADEKAKLVAEQAQGAEVSSLKLALQQREDELDALRSELADAQKATVRMRTRRRRPRRPWSSATRRSQR